MAKDTQMSLDYSRHYRKWHPNTDEHYHLSSASEIEDLRNHLPRDQGASIFELGAGMGLSLFALRRIGFRNLVGIDSDQSQIDAARERGLPVEFVPVSETISWLQRRAETFDFAFAKDVLEHVPRRELVELIRHVHASLKPGGIFVCRVPNCNSVTAARQRYIDWTHEDTFSPEGLDFVLFNGGFSRIEITGAEDPGLHGVGGHVRGVLRVAFRTIRRLQYFAEATGNEWTMPLSSNLIGVCHK